MHGPATIEIWKTVPGTKGRYEVNSFGRVRGPAGKILKRRVTIWGYDRFVFYDGSERKECTVHKSVCEAFNGPRPSALHEVNHINCDRLDNRPENLEWVTRQENADHRVKFGKSSRGENNARAKLRQADVPVIREMRAAGKTYKAIAEQFGVHKNTIWWAVTGGTWAEGAPA